MPISSLETLFVSNSLLFKSPKNTAYIEAAFILPKYHPQRAI